MKTKRPSSKHRLASQLGTEVAKREPNTIPYPEIIRADTSDIDKNENLQNGLAKLVLTIVKLLLEIVERQAYRAVISGSLSEEEVERLGNALIKIRQEFAQMLQKFELSPDELDLALGKLIDASRTKSQRGNVLNLPSLINLIDRIIEKETIIAGQATVALAGVDLVIINLLAILQPARIMKSASNREGSK